MDATVEHVVLQPRERARIEAWLGRALTGDECRPAASLAELSSAARGVVDALAARQIAICVRYLLAIVAVASVRDVLLFAHRPVS